MPIKQVFKSSMLSMQYLLKNGKSCPFIAGEYMTDVKDEIDQIEAEIAGGHPYIYRDAKKLEVNTDDMDPIETIKKKAIADYIASQKKAIDPERNMGTSSGSGGAGTGIATSAGNREVATASDSGSPANVEAGAAQSSGAKLINVPASLKKS